MVVDPECQSHMGMWDQGHALWDEQLFGAAFKAREQVAFTQSPHLHPGLCLRWFGQIHIRSAVGHIFVRRSMESKQRTCTCLFATIIPRKSHGLVHLSGVSALEMPWLQSLCHSRVCPWSEIEVSNNASVILGWSQSKEGLSGDPGL